MGDTWVEQKLTRVLDRVPGYSGYRDKENRRDADRAVRDRLFADLSARAERIERVAGRMADERRIGEIGPVNAFATAVRYVADRVNTASYGYGGVMGNRDVNAAVLDQMRLFDESLFAGVEGIDGAVSELEAAAAGADVRAIARKGESLVDAFSARFDARARIVETASPATQDQVNTVLAVLKTPEEIAAATASPAAYDLHDRDAIAVLGDNYVVDARIDIEAASGSFRIFRVDVAPDKWLLVPKRAGEPFAIMTATQNPYVSVPSPTIDGEAYSVVSSGHGSGDVIGVGGESGKRPLAYTLLVNDTKPSKRAIVLQWGAEQHVLVGTEVHADDVEIFGKPK